MKQSTAGALIGLGALLLIIAMVLAFVWLLLYLLPVILLGGLISLLIGLFGSRRGRPPE